MKIFLAVASLLLVSNAHVIRKRAAGDQQPKVWDALRQLRGGKDLTTEEIQAIYISSVPGQDYPINAVIPEKEVDCKAYKQAGFYADDTEPSKCQIFHRCDENGNVKSFLCPNATLFNQITLVCEWFYNVDCAQSKSFVDYSNSRLADQNAVLLDDQADIKAIEGATGGRAGKAENGSPTAPDAEKAAAEPTSAPAVEAATEAPAAETTAEPAEPALTDAPTEAPATEAPAPETTAAPAEPAATEAPTEAPATEVPAAETTPEPAEPELTEAPTEVPATEAPAAEETTAAPSAFAMQIVQ